MGYKLAGYDVVGCCEIDPRQVALYSKNLRPRYVFQDDIRKLAQGGDVPDELRDLDILDGSPPCTLFSPAQVKAEELRGKPKKFREGQIEQVLDDLFFWFLDLAERLRPKVIVAENVSGMMRGSAQKYVGRIRQRLSGAGYLLSFNLLNGETMGLPQSRARLFFVAVRGDLAASAGLPSFGMVDRVPALDMRFDEPSIGFGSVMETIRSKGISIMPERKPHTLPQFIKDNWEKCREGMSFGELHPRGSFFNNAKLHPGMPVPTITTFTSWTHIHHEECRGMNVAEMALCNSFPLDYDYLSEDPYYVNGMSVPPVMMAQVSARVWKQWLSRIKAIRQ